MTNWPEDLARREWEIATEDDRATYAARAAALADLVAPPPTRPEPRLRRLAWSLLTAAAVLGLALAAAVRW